MAEKKTETKPGEGAVEAQRTLIHTGRPGEGAISGGPLGSRIVKGGDVVKETDLEPAAFAKLARDPIFKAAKGLVIAMLVAFALAMPAPAVADGTNITYPSGIGWGGSHIDQLATVFGTVDTAFTGVKNTIGAPVADVTALKAVAATARADGQFRIVKSGADGLARLYRFVSASSAANDNDTVVQPTAGTGRWLRIDLEMTGDTGTGGTAGLVGAPAAGDAAAGKYWKADGTWTAPPDTTYTDFVGDTGAGGTAGLVPAPVAGDAAAGAYLDASGTFTVPPDTDTTYTAAVGGGLTLTTTAFSLLLTCTDQYVLKWSDGAPGSWACAADEDTTYSAFGGDAGAGGTAGLVPAPAAGDAAAGKFVKADGTWAVPPDTDTTYADMVGDSGAGGVAGLAPAPAAGDAAAGKYLDADGTWTVPPDTDTTYSTDPGGGIVDTAGTLTLLTTCTDNQVLEYTTLGGWACLATPAGGTPDDNSVTPAKIAEVVSADPTFGVQMVINHNFDAGIAAAADDVTVYAVDTLPRARLWAIKVEAQITAGADAGRTIEIRTVAGGVGGVLVATIDCATTGYKVELIDPDFITAGVAAGLFLRRSHDAIAGAVMLTVLPVTAP